jgi:hypothetical protein
MHHDRARCAHPPRHSVGLCARLTAAQLLSLPSLPSLPSSPPPPLSPLLPLSSASPLTPVTRKRRSRCARPASVACQPLPFVRLSLTHQASLHSSCFHSFAISISSLPLPYPSCSLCSHRFMFASHRKARNPSPLLGLSPSFLFHDSRPLALALL